MSSADRLREAVSRLLQAQGYRDTTKNRQKLVKRYLEIDLSVLDTPDEIFVWKFLNTSEDV